MKSNDLYKYASSGMVKKAFEFNTTAKAGLIGALGGAGLGALSDYLTPKDKDENRTKRLLTNILSGALMGGLTGVGGSTLYNQLVKPHSSSGSVTSTTSQTLEPNTESWFQRNAPDFPYEAAAIIPATNATIKLKNAITTTNQIRAVNELNDIKLALSDQAKKLKSSTPTIENPNPLGSSATAENIMHGINAVNGKTIGLSNLDATIPGVQEFVTTYGKYKEHTSFSNWFRSLFNRASRDAYLRDKVKLEVEMAYRLSDLGKATTKNTTPNYLGRETFFNKKTNPANILKTIKRTGGAGIKDVNNLKGTRLTSMKGVGRNALQTLGYYLAGKALGGISDAVRESVQ